MANGLRLVPGLAIVGRLCCNLGALVALASVSKHLTRCIGPFGGTKLVSVRFGRRSLATTYDLYALKRTERAVASLCGGWEGYLSRRSANFRGL